MFFITSIVSIWDCKVSCLWTSLFSDVSVYSRDIWYLMTSLLTLKRLLLYTFSAEARAEMVSVVTTPGLRCKQKNWKHLQPTSAIQTTTSSSSERKRQQSGLLGLCSEDWRGQKAQQWGLQKTNTHRSAPPTGTWDRCHQTLQHRPKEIATRSQGEKKEQEYRRTALQTCSHPDWAFTKTSKKRDPSREEERNNPHSISVPHSLECQGNLPAHFKASNTLRQKLVHPKDKTPRHKQSNIVYAIQYQEECRGLCIGETAPHKHGPTQTSHLFRTGLSIYV